MRNMSHPLMIFVLHLDFRELPCLNLFLLDFFVWSLDSDTYEVHTLPFTLKPIIGEKNCSKCIVLGISSAKFPGTGIPMIAVFHTVFKSWEHFHQGDLVKHWNKILFSPQIEFLFRAKDIVETNQASDISKACRSYKLISVHVDLKI